VGKNFRKFAKFIGRRKKVLLLTVVLVFAVFFLVGGTVFYSWLQLLLKGGIGISVDSERDFVLTDSREQENISFRVEVKNRFFCSAECFYEFRDLSHDKVLERENFPGRNGITFNRSYVVSPPNKGTGQLAYEFYTECNSQKTLLCRTEGGRVKSSFVTLVYERSIAEREFVEKVQESLLKFLKSMENLDRGLQLMNHAELAVSKINGDAKLQSVNIQFSSLLDSVSQLKDAWENEEYNQIEPVLLNSTVGRATLELAELEDELLYFTLQHGTVVESLQKFQSKVALLPDLNVAQAIMGKKFDRRVLNSYLSIIHSLNTWNYSSLAKLQGDFLSLNTSYELLFAASLDGVNSRVGEVQVLVGGEVSTAETLQGAINSFAEACIQLEMDLPEYFAEKCGYTPAVLDLSIYNFTVIPLDPWAEATIYPRVNSEIFEHKPICCIFGKCQECCQNCADKYYPLVLVHGHAVSTESSISYSLGGFDKIRRQLVADGYLDAGTVLPTDTSPTGGILGRFGKPIVVGTTYYLDAYNHDGKIVSVPSKSEDIATYAQRLDKSIGLIKEKTGANKVNILAFSMGGLVARQYLLDFGEESVNKLITIGTPHQGISGKIESFCPITGSKKECLEMTSTSKFINELNRPNNSPTIKVYAIAGSGCTMNGVDGDGAVTSASAQLSSALNFEIYGSCSSKTFHEELRDIHKYPRVYAIIRALLSE
jgi:hypothetical protein